MTIPVGRCCCCCTWRFLPGAVAAPSDPSPSLLAKGRAVTTAEDSEALVVVDNKYPASKSVLSTKSGSEMQKRDISFCFVPDTRCLIAGISNRERPQDCGYRLSFAPGRAIPRSTGPTLLVFGLRASYRGFRGQALCFGRLSPLWKARLWIIRGILQEYDMVVVFRPVRRFVRIINNVQQKVKRPNWEFLIFGLRSDQGMPLIEPQQRDLAQPVAAGSPFVYVSKVSS